MAQMAMFDSGSTAIRVGDVSLIREPIIANHYLHRWPCVNYAFAMYADHALAAVVTFGQPPSRNVQKSVCPTDPDKAIELNRLWVDDSMPRNTASEFVMSAIRQLPPFLIFSYADIMQGHTGTIYRAMNFKYCGWTDEDRKTPRYDYVVPGAHSRKAFRIGKFTRELRTPKLKYWIASGDKRDRKRLGNICGWVPRKWDGGPTTRTGNGNE